MSDQEVEGDYYNRPSLPLNRGIWSTYQTQQREHSAGYLTRGRMERNPSEHSLRNARNGLRTQVDERFIPARKQNLVIANLRSQLQNIKSQVAKMVGKDPAEVVSQRSSEYIIPHRDHYADSSQAASSIVLGKRNKAIMPTTPTSKGKYLELQNEVLKNELKTLKNKYVMRKNEYKEELQTQRKKNLFLQRLIAEGEEEMAQYKSEIEEDIATIRSNMVNRISEVNENYSCEQHVHRIQALEKECEEAKQEIVYLKKRTIEANEQIKKMAIVNNDLTNQIKKERRNTDIDKIEVMRMEFDEKIKEKGLLLTQRDQQIREMASKQGIANEVVRKNAELIDTLNTERQRYQSLEAVHKTKIEQLAQAHHYQSNFHQLQQVYSGLQNEYNQLRTSYQQIARENQTLKGDVSELGNMLTNLKLLNEELTLRNNQNSTYKLEQSENQSLQRENESLHRRNRQLEDQLMQFKQNVSEMIHQTAQKINHLEVQNQALRGQTASQQGLPFHLQHLTQENQLLLSAIREYKLKIDASEAEILSLKQQVRSLEKRFGESSQFIEIPSTNDLVTQGSKGDNPLQSHYLMLSQSLQLKEQQLISIKADNKQFRQLCSRKCQELQELKADHQKQIEQYQQKQILLDEMMASVNQRAKEYQQAYNRSVKQATDLLTPSATSEDLDENLRIQMDSITKLRATISTKNEQIQSLRQSATSLGAVVDSLKQELETLRSGWKREREQNKTQLQNCHNSLIIMKKSVDSFKEKIKVMVEENKKKDDFILKYVTQNRAQNQLQMKQLIDKYQQIFTSSAFVSVVGTQMSQIERLTNENSALMHELSTFQQWPQRWEKSQQSITTQQQFSKPLSTSDETLIS